MLEDVTRTNIFERTFTGHSNSRHCSKHYDNQRDRSRRRKNALLNLWDIMVRCGLDREELTLSAFYTWRIVRLSASTVVQRTGRLDR